MKYILFDLDGTLMDFHLSERKAFISTIESFTGYTPTDEECKLFARINENLFNRFARNEFPRIVFQQKRFEEIYTVLQLRADVVSSNQYFLNTLKYQADLFPDVFPVLEYLSGKYELYIASNGMDIVQRKRLESAGISKYFKDVFVSDVPGVNKPGLVFFEYVFQSIGDKNKDEYVIIGDRLDTDIKGGMDAGIHTIYLSRDKKVEGAISSLDELLKIF